MTPSARYAAAAEIVDRIAAGTPAEQALTNWSRGARYAGSKDRAAVRDHVFDILRRWRSTAALGGGETGRARVLGLLRQEGVDPDGVFTGEGHAPAALSDAERGAGRSPEGAEARDLPDWLATRFAADLGPDAAPVAEALRQRAPVFVRVNRSKADRATAQARLDGEGIASRFHPKVETALEITAGARGLSRSGAYLDGWIELQDAASQAVTEALPAASRILDYCAGGGGKALALAARLPRARIEAHDADPRRMADLPARAARAGAEVRVVDRPEGRYDLVLCDVPCSGSGSWRRAPDGKWRLTETRLAELCAIQASILDSCAGLVATGGTLAYVTCSVLTVENAAQIAAFTERHPAWRPGPLRRFLPGPDGDGFFMACLHAP